MAEINLFIEGHTDSRRRAADMVRRSILYAARRYGMDIREFQSQQAAEDTKTDIPDFMSRQFT